VLGNVGIGTNAPSTYGKFVVLGSGNSGVGTFIGNASLTGSAPTYQGSIRLLDNPTSSTAASGGIEFLTSTFGSGYGWKMAAIDSSGVQLTFATRQNSAAWTEAMRIDSGGNVGIGTSSPINKLQVTDASFATIRLKLTANANGTIWNDNASTTDFTCVDARAMTFGTSNTERMRISSAGIVTMSAYGAGAATFSAAGVISSVSDETWKIKDGVPVDPDSMLKKLEPGYWYYNDEKKEIFGTSRELGFYAQNVNAAIGPEAAPTPEEGKPWGYYDRSVLAVTVMSLQKALATIESLTARITALEST
jgi:hypothetical protein